MNEPNSHIKDLIETAAIYQDMVSGEDLDDLERAISRDDFLKRLRQDAIYRDAAGPGGSGEI